jgi:hypothetical protein
MNRWNYVICIALFQGLMACALDPGDEGEPGASELGGGEDDVLGTVLEAKKDVAPGERKPREEPPPPPPPSPSVPGFIDACGIAGHTNATFNPTASFDAFDEGVTAALNLPFSFTFYGTAHTKFWFTTNGQLGFGNTVGGTAFGQVTCPISSAAITTPLVLVYSADLIGRIEPNAGVCYATTGTAPNRKLVVTWKNSFFYEAWLLSNVTFSATLNEGTNVIDVALERVDVDDPSLPDYELGHGAALGRRSGSSSQTVSCYQALVPEGTVIQYNP